jgi:pimeloyl-ACP methyl ester carboxylesterase
VTGEAAGRYTPRRAAVRSQLRIRGVSMAVTRWGAVTPAAHVYLHGFLDLASTFQFLVEDYAVDRPIVAPDWRGFGRSEASGPDYWFPDYLADLDHLLEALSPDAPVVLVGHSMGGNVASLYAGIRPERVRALVLLEGFGLPDQPPTAAPGRYRDWLRDTHATQSFRAYPTVEALAERLRTVNPRLAPERALYLAAEGSRVLDSGAVEFLADPGHRRVNPTLYRRAEAEACWRAVTCPVLQLLGAESNFRRELGHLASPAYFAGVFGDVEVRTLPGAGHMLHHDDSAACARAIEEFFQRIAV